MAAVATAAGGAAWVSAVGSGVVALRLRQADLPIEPVVALMSAEHRFAIGAGILIFPLLAGLIGFLADWVAGREPAGDSEETTPSEETIGSKDKAAREKGDRRRRQCLAAGTVVGGGALVYLTLRPSFETLAFGIAAVAIAVPIAFEVLHWARVERHGFYERLAVFLVVLVAAGAGAILAEVHGSPSFDETEIRIRDQAAPITGGYITSTEHSVVLSPRCEVIEAVPRDRIERISVGPSVVTRSRC